MARASRSRSAHGALPDAAQLAAFREGLAARRALPSATLALLRECARAKIDHMDALRIALGIRQGTLQSRLARAREQVADVLEPGLAAA